MTLPNRSLAFSEYRGNSEGSVPLEQELILRALQGDGHAFASLVGPHLPLLYRIAQRACGSSALAEDAVQETLALAFKKLGSYEAGTSLKAFLGAIAARQALTLLRSERRRRRREEATVGPEPTANPAEQLTAQRLAERVREALAQMPKKRQQVALLRLDANLSYLEIAQATGTTEGSARVLVHLVLKELKEKLSDVISE
ncbi:MAG: RNA polymerase sigma factor [Polyangiaceae bacterium]|nr:RNA polymerase sigma factor [Polyangiaceae bacterium]